MVMRKALFLAITLGLSACSMVYQQDTRNSQAEWQDAQHVIQIAGIVNKPPYNGRARINAVSYEGNLLVVGQTQDAALKQQLLEQVRKIAGVKVVYDQIRITPPLPLAQVTQDTWITTKIKSTLVASKKLKNVNIKVITENGEVFLLGYVTKQQANEATEIARNLSGVKQVIKGFHYVEDNAPQDPLKAQFSQEMALGANKLTLPSELTPPAS